MDLNTLEQVVQLCRTNNTRSLIEAMTILGRYARQDLPNDVKTKIVSYLSCQQLIRLLRVSSSWNKLLQDASLWKPALKRDLGFLPTLSDASGGYIKLAKEHAKLMMNWKYGIHSLTILGETSDDGHEDIVYCVEFNKNFIVTGSKDSIYCS
jgi:hypothetical protein